MKITRVEVRVLKVNLPAGHIPCRPIVCRIFTDEGLYGDGEAAMLLMTGASASYGMLQDLAQFILNMDPLDHELIWNKLYRKTYFAQNGGPTMYSAISAIDVALWDIKGKYFNVPVYKLLGGKQRDTVRCYASQINSGWGRFVGRPKTPEEFAECAREAVREGYDTVKADFFIINEEGKLFTAEDRTGLGLPCDLRLVESRIAAVREAIGPDRDLIVEGHGYTDASVGLQLGERLAQYGVLYYEEPCTPFLPTATLLAQKLKTPIAGGERLFSRWQFYPYMAAHAYHVFQPDVGDCGGITEIKKIIDMADLFELPVQIHTCSTPLLVGATLNVEAAMNRFSIHEHTGFQTRDFIRELGKYDWQPENGHMTIPDLPGIGNELSDYALQHYESLSVIQ